MFLERRNQGWILGLAIFLLPSMVFGFTRTVTDGGTHIEFQPDESGQIYIPLAGNALNSAGLDHTDLYLSVVRGLQRWQEASRGTIRFDYWQGLDPNIYVTDSNFNEASSLYFASVSEPGQQLVSSSIIGLTQVWFDTGSGDILETDIVINDLDFQFSLNPADTSGSGSGLTTGTKIYIDNVITHELGHALGLSHSGNLQSTMLFMEAPDQAHLSCDDIHGIRTLYPGAANDGTGVLQGRVDSSQGGVFGAQVSAISRSRGVAFGSALTEQDGSYRLEGLEPGEYLLLVEPYYAGPKALSAFFSGIDSDLCGGTPFGRTFYTEGSGPDLRQFTVSAGATIDAGSIVVDCTVGAGAHVSGPHGSGSFGTAPSFVSAESESKFAWVDRFPGGGSQYYELSGIEGNLKLHAMAYSLYSPLRVSLELYDSFQNPVASKKQEPVYSSETGFSNYDALLEVEGLVYGDYVLRVSTTTLTQAYFPAGAMALDANPFIVFSGGLNEGTPAKLDVTPVNAKCRLEEEFSTYLSPGGGPPHADSEADYGLLGFCGSLDVDQLRKSPPPSTGAIIGWFLPWFAMAFLARALRRRLLFRYGKA